MSYLRLKKGKKATIIIELNDGKAAYNGLRKKEKKAKNGNRGTLHRLDQGLKGSN